ncbi:MAG: protein phosphatase 2C domain-containing protein, partial [Proteobacteria bacterium]|nr:protein phosphatase 2C domain-containing protein [Pseudomonadota bacterium]
MKFSIFQDSRVGARSYNQDRLGYWYTRDSLLLVLADGMGGHLMGEVAAQIAVDTLGASFQKDAKTRIPDPDLFLYRSVGRIHAAIDEHTQRLDLPDSPRTTLVA